MHACAHRCRGRLGNGALELDFELRRAVIGAEPDMAFVSDVAELDGARKAVRQLLAVVLDFLECARRLVEAIDAPFLSGTGFAARRIRRLSGSFSGPLAFAQGLLDVSLLVVIQIRDVRRQRDGIFEIADRFVFPDIQRDGQRDRRGLFLALAHDIHGGIACARGRRVRHDELHVGGRSEVFVRNAGQRVSSMTGRAASSAAASSACSGAASSSPASLAASALSTAGSAAAEASRDSSCGCSTAACDDASSSANAAYSKPVAGMQSNAAMKTASAFFPTTHPAFETIMANTSSIRASEDAKPLNGPAHRHLGRPLDMRSIGVGGNALHKLGYFTRK